MANMTYSRGSGKNNHLKQTTRMPTQNGKSEHSLRSEKLCKQHLALCPGGYESSASLRAEVPFADPPTMDICPPLPST